MNGDQVSLRKKISLELFRIYRHNQAKLHPLQYLFWECTLRCNLNCLHCGSDCSKESVVRDMPVEDFIQAIDHLNKSVEPHQTMIVFTGGEPLLRKDLEKAGQALYERGYPWGLVTNGSTLTARRLNSLLEAGLRAITISLDGLESSHNWLRNTPQGFSKTVESIRMTATVKDLVMDVVTCVNNRNLHELESIKQLLIDLQVEAWRIFTIFPTGRAAGNDDLKLDKQEFREVFEFIRGVRKENRITLNYGCEGFLGEYEKEVRDHFFFCKAGIHIASVLADGSIAACPNLRKNFIQGNIYKDDLANVWNNRYQIYRNRQWTKTGKCASCRDYRYCEGSGMHLWNEHGESPAFCHLEKLG